MKSLLHLFRRHYARAWLAVTLLLLGCEPAPVANSLEVVYDSERYQIRLHQQRVSVFDHRLQQIVFTSPVSTLISAHQTTLSASPSLPAGLPQERTAHSCTHAVIDKAEPNSQHLLLSGSFSSPDCAVRFGLHFAQAGTQLLMTMTTNDETYNHLTLGFDAPLDETVIGFGAQATHLNFKGLNVPIWVQSQGIGRGNQPVSTLLEKYHPASTGSDLDSDYTVPYFLSSAHYSLFLDNAEFSRFDFRQRQATRVHNYSSTLRAHLTSCAKLLDCVTRYTHVSGRMKALPDWTQHGAIVGLSGGTDKVLNRYRQLKDREVPVTAVWLNDLDTGRYDDIQRFQQQLQQDDARLLGHFTPYLIDSAAHSHFHEARDKGYLVKNAQGDVYNFEVPDASVTGNSEAASTVAALVDLTHPEAYQWLQAILKKRIKTLQLSGWLADFGEGLPADAQLHNGRDPLHFHNQFPLEWARLNQQLLKEAGSGSVFMTRSGFIHSPSTVSAFALSRQNTSWDAHDGLQSAVIGLLNSGVSGVTLNHADIGGTTSLQVPVSPLSQWLLPNELVLDDAARADSGPAFALRRSPELLQRWVELSAFTPLLRSGEGLTPAINAQIYDSDELGRHFARNIRLFQAMAPYRQELMQEAEKKGWPLLRHPLLHFPEEMQFHKMPGSDLQFMLGDSIMIAPMLTPMEQRKHRQVFLPKGEWLEVGTGRLLIAGETGRMLQVSPPLGLAPAYLRNNERSRELILPALQQAGFMPTQLAHDGELTPQATP